MRKLCWLLILISLVGCGKKTDEIQKKTKQLEIQGQKDDSLKQLKDAIDSQDTQFVQREIDQNKDVLNSNFKDGETPLTYAIRQKNERIINMLIEAADVNLRGKGGLAPLHLSIILNLENVMDSLLRKGAKIEAASLLNETPLYFAISFERSNMALKLLTMGANYERKSDLNMSAKELAQGFRQTKVINLIKDIDSARGDSFNIEQVLSAVENDNTDFFNYIINMKSNIKELSIGENIITQIIRGKSLFKLQYIENLLEVGLNPNGERDDDTNPIIEAARIGSLSIVEELFYQGGEVNFVQETPYHTNALFEAVKNINFPIVQFLFTKGAEKRINYVYGSTLYFIDACNSLPRRNNGLNDNEKFQRRMIKNLLDC